MSQSANPFDHSIFTDILSTLGDSAGNVTAIMSPPVNARVKLACLTFTLITDANVAGRVPRIELSDGTNVMPIAVSQYTVTASSTEHFIFATGAPFTRNSAVGRTLCPLPDNIYLYENGFIRLVIENGLAGDTKSGIRRYWQLWPWEQ